MTDPTRDAEQAVQSAVDHLAKWPQSMNRDEFLADVEVLLAAARQAENRIATLAERARIRGIVEGVYAEYAAPWKSTILAALDGPE